MPDRPVFWYHPYLKATQPEGDSGHLTLCPNARENLSRGVIASPWRGRSNLQRPCWRDCFGRSAPSQWLSGI